MRPLRWIYYSVMAIMLLAGMYSGMRVYYIIFLIQLLIVIAVFIINFWTAQTFKFTQQLSRNICVKGEEVILNIEIVNEKPFPLSLIEVNVDVVSYGENVRLIFSLAPNTSKSFSIPISTPYRGCYSIGMTKLKITDIFGLISFPFDMRRLFYYKKQELVVMPKTQISGAVSADIIDTKLFSNTFLMQAEKGDSVSGARQYRDGDVLKRVHWKKSAQQGQLFVKQYEYPERERAMIFIDTSVYGLKDAEALVYADTVCECAASITLHSLSRDRSVCILNSANYLKPIECESIYNLSNIQKYLALLTFAEHPDLFSTLQNARLTLDTAYALFIITRGADVASMQRLELLLKDYHSVTLVTVGGPRAGGRIHTIYVEAGSDAAESLRSLF